MTRPLRIVITTGDADGIGSEVACKALAKIKPIKGVQFFLWRSPRCPSRDLKNVDRAFRRITVANWPEALKVKLESHKQIIDINSNLPPPLWVEAAAQACLFGHADAIATAPLSKTAIASAGLSDIGHTDILKRLSKTEDLFQGFIGDKFSVVLATAHIPIENVKTRLTKAKLEKAIRVSLELRSLLDKKSASRPLAVLGLNPHAGEQGLIGNDETNVHLPLIKKLKAEDVPLEGPLVPDAAFFQSNWKKYAVFVANYHDQGLIPFKMIHGQESGIHITLGLPFVRTSVDHGTAKDIFGKNKADASSMRLAIEWAVRLAKARKSKLNA